MPPRAIPVRPAPKAAGRAGGWRAWIPDWITINPGDIISRLGKSIIPTLTREVDVIVYGDPNASRKDLYHIALAAAFGHMNNAADFRLSLPVGMILLEYHSEINVVRVLCKQTVSWTGMFANPAALFNNDIVFGPKENLRGGGWRWFLGAIVGPLLEAAGIAENKYKDKMILTKSPAYNNPGEGVQASANTPPRQDNLSRGALPIASMKVLKGIKGSNFYTRPDYLLFQSLKAPCNAQETLNKHNFPSGTADPENYVFELTS